MSDNVWRFIFLFAWFALKAQTEFQFPIRLNPDLSGGFGDLRKNHFHSGLDIRTGGKIGEPVYAVADGWIYRIKISTKGFGNAIYIQHDNGYLTAYAHLDKFIPVLEDSVFNRQRQVQQNYVDWYFPPKTHRVKKGDLIAWSGNSGSSGGPHLHFEIRENEETIINPLPFYKSLFQDTYRPVPEKIRFRPIAPNAYIQRSPTPKEFIPVSLGNGKYKVADTVFIHGLVGIEYVVTDRLRPEAFKINVPRVSLWIDDSIHYRFQFEKFGFEEKRQINHHVDYKVFTTQGEAIQRCFVGDGSTLQCYPEQTEAGRIQFFDSNPHSWKLVFSDIHGNTTEVTGCLRNIPPPPFPTFPETSSVKPGISLVQSDQALYIKISPVDRQTLEGLEILLDDGSKQLLKPTAWDTKSIYYHWEVQAPFPVKIQNKSGSIKQSFHYRTLIYPGRDNQFEWEGLSLLTKHGFNPDTFALEIKNQGMRWDTWSPIYKIGRKDHPLMKAGEIRIRATRPIPNPNQMFVANCEGSQAAYLENQIRSGDYYGASFSEFGSFCLACDQKAPVISSVTYKPGGSIQFSISDSGGAGLEENSVAVFVNEIWLPAELKSGNTSQQKRSIDAHLLPKGLKSLEIQVSDRVGNKAVKKMTLP